MPVQTGTATNYLTLLSALVDFVCGYGTYAAPTFAGTGNGTLGSEVTFPATVTETWTIKCTSATTVGAEVWSVTGSVSGALASATTGVAYTNGKIGFTITAGTVNFAVNDAFTLATTEGAMSTAGSAWALLASNLAPTDGNDAEYFLKAPGLTGSEGIYINITAYHNTTNNLYNWGLAGATGYNSSQPIANQPGQSPVPAVPLWNQSLPYTFIANGQRFIMSTQVSTVWEQAYAGKILPYGTPGQYPYPLFIGASGLNNTIRYSDTTWYHQAFFDPGSSYIYWIDGTWQPIVNHDSLGNPHVALVTWPYLLPGNSSPPGSTPTFLEANLDGSYPLLPVRLEMQTPAQNMLGELDGVFFTTGFSLSAGSTLTVGTTNYQVVQNTFRTGTNNFAALELT